ncbi:hypothetical protein CFC21_056489 [Triticum aestivum]|uniref:PIR2-like helical domain-containing protein n=2 Tax=Triticum aestivum TaxID=4565 RepID=A0A9R1GJ14_WHEAT|nr:uncharacterized protein LOC123090903 [Triticum aestivum]KAF7047579.1 hypothetical protein CFC21_056488 [Triticum aestivum]KAF7047580.1 hypothetical protein CFC21_056489 [Triticum aestivum]
MASGSASSGGSVPLGSLSGSTSSGDSSSRRGLISCLHSLNCRHEYAPLPHDDDLCQATRKLIVGHYDEAFRRLRLPCKAMPDLYGLLSTDSLCIGPLDPVSNIILNTLALLPTTLVEVEAKTESDEAESDDESMRSKRKRHGPGFDPWHEVACRSAQSLMAFLVAYFGCINEAQAFRYLYRAGANLLLAVMLVQHDLYHTKEEALDPESDRTKAALKLAATSAGHCSPAIFAQVMAIRLKQGDLDLFNQHLFSANDPLTAEDAHEIHRGLHMMMTPMCVANISNSKDGLVVHARHNLDDGAIWSETKPLVSSSAAAHTRITSTTFRCDGTAISSLQSGLPSKLQDCLTIADFQKHILIASCGGDNCDYLRSLKMYLYGMIHNLYVQAFKMLRAPSGSTMRSILMAGHCYGPCDPLSNIIINSVWHETCGSVLPASDRMMLKEYNDILDPLSLLRLVVRSLEGLANLALSVDPQSSIARALEKLCSARCDLVDMLSSAPKIDEIPFHEAAMAARQPLPLQLGEFHRMLLLNPEARKLLVSHITKAQTSGVVLFYDKIREDVVALWRVYKAAPWYQPPVQAPAPELSVEALRRVSDMRSQYEYWRSWLRSKIEQVLKDYTDHHFWGPKYELDFIIGADQRQEGYAPSLIRAT